MYINERACSKWPMAIFVTIYTCIEEITDRKSWQMTLSRKIYLLKKNNVLTATVCVAKNLMKKNQVLVRVYSTDYQRPCDLPPIFSK